MRFSRPFLVLVLAAVAGPSCTSEDQAPVFVDFEYQLRCIDCQPVAQDAPKRDIKALDGDNDFSTGCSVGKQGGKRELSFSARYSDPKTASNSYEIRVSQARFEGKDPGAECSVRVIEGGNTYQGDCTSGEPSLAQPCKLTFDEAAGGMLTGTLYCDGIANTSSPSLVRYVTDTLDNKKPAKFSIDNCRGL